MQAKRYDPSHALGSDEIDQFSGAIDRRGATLGVMVTTSRFTAAARKAADGARNKRLVLIDGDQLADLMVEHDVAVRTVQTIHVKKIDDEYLEEIED
jgi:restriction system protein